MLTGIRLVVIIGKISHLQPVDPKPFFSNPDLTVIFRSGFGSGMLSKGILDGQIDIFVT